MKLKKSTFALAAALLCAGAAPSALAAQERPVIAQASDLPPVVIELPAKPSVLVVEGGPGYDAVVDRVEAYARDVLDGYEIADPAARRQLLGILVQAAIAEERWDDVLALSGQIRALEEKPAARAMSGLLSNAYARAAKAVGDDSPQFPERFEQELASAVRALDWDVAQDALQGMRGQFQLLSRDLLIGGIQGGLDPNAEAQEMRVGAGIGAAVVGARTTLTRFVPLKDRVFAVLDRRVQAEATEKVDRWSERTVTLQPAQVRAPVTVAVWDGGFDPEVFEGNLWTNEDEQANGRDDDGNGFVDDVHGIAFDPDWKRSTGALRPMPAEDLDGIDERLRLVKGSLDLQAAVDSPEANAFRQRMGSLKPEEVTPFALQMGRIGLYLHGTATGFTSAEGNPGAQLMSVRFDYRIQPVPEPVDEAKAEEMARYAEDVVNYMRENGVRVANMSWRITEPQIAATLASIEPDPNRRKERAKAIFDTIEGALTRAFQSAPDILFVAGAGNEDEDVDFVRSFPAGINLPNVVTVGAVDVALQPAGFTSYGESIDLYANGFEVPSKVPGGMPIRISGTSLAAPYVTNLAAKLLAVNPGLSVAEVRSIIESTATAEGPKGLKVINPAAALARATATASR